MARLVYFGSESDDAKLCGCQVCGSRGCLGGVQSPTPFGVEKLAITIFDGILGVHTDVGRTCCRLSGLPFHAREAGGQGGQVKVCLHGHPMPLISRP